MAVNIELKRSAVPGKVPSTGSLNLGEIAINTYDGKAYFKKDDGTESIIELASTSGSVATASFATSASYALTASYSETSTSSSYAISASYAFNATSASYAATASSADNFLVRGTLTAQTIVAQTITSSTEFITGSTKFGTQLIDTHQFTGSVSITGSLGINGVDYTSTSASFDTRITNNSASIAYLSESYLASSASFDTRITNNSASISNLSSSFLAFSGSYSTGSFNGQFTGSFTGSFSGSLNNLQGTPTHIPFFSSSQVLADSAIYQVNTASIAINQTNITTANPEALYVSQTHPTSINVISGKGNLNNYLQLNIFNTNQGISASSDIVATANNGSETSNYIDMGINSENYAQNFIGAANDAYLYSTGNDLHIGNATSNKTLQFFVGGTDVDVYNKLQLNPDNLHIMSGSLDVSGSIKAQSFTGSLLGTASYAANANTASYSLIATSASYAVNTTSASYALTASYVANASSFPFTGSAIITGSLVVTGSVNSTEGLTGSLLGTASFANNATSASNALTASYVLNAVSASFASTASFVQTAQTSSYILQAVSASFASTASLAITASNALTASFVQNAVSSSFATTASYVLNAVSASFASTASSVNQLNQAVVVSGSLTVSGSTNFVGSTGTTLFSANADTLTFTGSIFTSGSIIATGSLSVSSITSSLLGTASYATQALTASNANTASYILNAVSSSFASTASFVANAQTASYVLNAVSASFATSASVAVKATTASYADNFTVAGTLTAQTIIVQTITSSTEFVTGSTKFGSQLSNTHQFTGSVSITGSLTVTDGVINNLTSSNAVTASYANTATSASYAITSSYSNNSTSASYAFNATSASYANNSTTASYALDADLLDGKDSTTFATTGSNIFIGNQTVTGSLFTSGSNTLVGSTTLTGSLDITGSTTQIGNNNLFGNTTLSGSIIISGSSGTNNPTVKVYGDITHDGYVRFNPVSTNIDTSISASYIYVSGSTNDLYFSQNGSGYNNVTRLRWLEGNLYTGLLNGGLITITTGSTWFNLSSGSGVIVDLNASLNDNPYPTIQYINWGNFVSQSLTYLTSSIQTFVGIDSNGQILQQTSPWNNGQYNTSISIGTVLHQNQTTVNASITYPNVAYGYKQRTYDFIKAFGPLKLSGLTIVPSGSLGLNVGSGTAWADGRNYQVDPNNPSYITDPGTAVSKIFRYYQSGSSFVQDTNAGAGYTVIDPANYNNNGTLTGVSPSTPFTIQRVFWYPNSATKGIVVYYGNAQYASIAEAEANLNYETFNEVENTKQNAVYLGAIIIKYNGVFTNPVDYIILPGGIFRSVGGSGGGGSVVTATLAGLSDVSISGPTDGQALVYSSTTTKWGNKSFISASISGNAATSTTASYALTASYVLNSVSASFATTASYAFNATTASYALAATSASYALNTTSASYAATSSYANNFTVAGTLTAQTIVAQTITSSVEYVTGSTQFGSLLSNTHQFTGSVSITGSLTVNGPATLNNLTGSLFGTASWASNAITSSYSLTATSASYALNATSASYATNADNAQTASYILNAVSASYALNATTASHALTASYVNTLNQNVLITGSLAVGATSIGASENTLTLGARDTAGEGGQLGLNASGGIYTSASMLDTYQDRFRILRGTNASSDAEFLNVNLHSGQVTFNRYTGSGTFPGTVVAALAVDSSGNIITTSTVTSASYALSASYATNADTAQTASYVLNAVSASYALNATSASYSLNSTSASYSLSGSYAVNATTASYALTSSNINGGQANYITLWKTANTVTRSVLYQDPNNNDYIGLFTTVPTYSLDVNGVIRAQSDLRGQQKVYFPGLTDGSPSTQVVIWDSAQGQLFYTGSSALSVASASYATTASYAVNTTSASYAFNATSASYAAIASSVSNIAGTVGYIPKFGLNNALGNSIMNEGPSGILVDTWTDLGYKFDVNGSARIANGLTVTGSIAATQNITASNALFTGTLTAQTIIAQYITSSTEYITGSTIFGSLLSNTHQFTGSVTITGSLAVNGSSVILTNQTSSMTVLSSSYALSASYASVAGSTPTATSASYAATASYASTFNIGLSQIKTATVASSIAGANNLFTDSTGSFSGAKYLYTVTNGTNARTGEVLAIWAGGSVQYTDNSTLDLGSTTAVTASVSIVTAQAQFNVQTNTSGWTIKSQVTYI